MRRRSDRVILIAGAILSTSLCLPIKARAQLVASGTIESQYRVRGVSLTNEEPDARLGVSYDHSSGVYAGASMIVGETARDGLQSLGYLGYVGFAHRLQNALTWDVGVTTSHITIGIPARQALIGPDNTVYALAYTRRYRADYTEAYAGLALGDVSARLYASPDYLGQRSLYLDLSGGIRPTDRLRLSAHAGVLTPLSGWIGPNSGRQRYDLRVGAGWVFRHAEVGLAVTTATPQVLYPLGVRQKPSALVLSATGFF